MMSFYWWTIIDTLKSSQAKLICDFLLKSPFCCKQRLIDFNVPSIYTSHSKDQKKEKVEVEQVEEKPTVLETKPIEQKEEVKTDDLSEISESVQKRIDKLTRRYREAERREQAALEFAKGLQKYFKAAPFNFEVKLMTRGLGEAILVLGEK